MRSFLSFVMAFAALTTVALAAEHPTVFALHIKNTTGGDVRLHNRPMYYMPACDPATGTYGDALAAGATRSFHCDTKHYRKDDWAQLVQVMSGDRNHIYCNIQIITGHGSISARGGAGDHCAVKDDGTSIEVVVH